MSDKDLCPLKSVFDDFIHHCACERGYSGEIIDLAGECTGCVNGTYTDTLGSASCTACPIGTNSSRLATAIDQCYCLPELWRRGDMSCGGCYPGTYGHDMICVACPPNMHSPDSATSIEECSCKAGTFQDPTEPGCINCGFGTYKEFEEVWRRYIASLPKQQRALLTSLLNMSVCLHFLLLWWCMLISVMTIFVKLPDIICISFEGFQI